MRMDNPLSIEQKLELLKYIANCEEVNMKMVEEALDRVKRLVVTT